MRKAVLNQAQIDLGLAATGNTVQQVYRKLPHKWFDRLHNGVLFLAQAGQLGRNRRTHRLIVPIPVNDLFSLQRLHDRMPVCIDSLELKGRQTGRRTQ